MTLITNRYGQVSPTSIYENGASVSTPMYFKPTSDQGKEILNAFRDLVKRQRQDMGYSDKPVLSTNGIAVQTASQVPQTPAEAELGMSEEALRYAIFSRQGIADRLIIKLCRLCNIELIPRSFIEQSVKEWLDHLYMENEELGTKKPNTTNKRTTKRTKPTSAPTVGNVS